MLWDLLLDRPEFRTRYFNTSNTIDILEELLLNEITNHEDKYVFFGQLLRQAKNMGLITLDEYHFIRSLIAEYI